MRKGITPLRKYNMKLRYERGLSLRDMAKDFNVSATFISSIEMGKHKIPENYIEKMSKLYDIKDNDLVELIRAVVLTNENVKINVKKLIKDENLFNQIVDFIYKDVSK